jgi:N-acetylglucosaminyldiphosphoundecaprenol N-acetyl-beta-D-mannosaminyltransferase
MSTSTASNYIPTSAVTSFREMLIPEPISIGALLGHPVTMDQAVNIVIDRAERGVGGYVVTPNVDYLCMAERDPEFRDACNAALLSLVDGVPVRWLTSMKGTPVPERVAGSDLLIPLLQRAAQRGLRVALVGGEDHTQKAARQAIEIACPGINIVHASTPWFDPKNPSPEFLADIDNLAASRPQIVIIAFAAAKQVAFMRDYLHRYSPGVALALGGTFRFLAGERRRAPKWMQKIGLEWVHRLASDPKYLARRYLIEDLPFAKIVTKDMLASRRFASLPGAAGRRRSQPSPPGRPKQERL